MHVSYNGILFHFYSSQNSAPRQTDIISNNPGGQVSSVDVNVFVQHQCFHFKTRELHLVFCPVCRVLQDQYLHANCSQSHIFSGNDFLAVLQHHWRENTVNERLLWKSVYIFSWMLTWPTAWPQSGIVGTSAGPPWSDCGPAWASSAGIPSAFWLRSRRPVGSAPAAAGARKPEEGRESKGRK